MAGPLYFATSVSSVLFVNHPHRQQLAKAIWLPRRCWRQDNWCRKASIRARVRNRKASKLLFPKRMGAPATKPAKTEEKIQGSPHDTQVVGSSANESQTLDPADWDGFRAQAHGMLDDILDYTQNIRQRPVWQPIPDEVRAPFRGGCVPAAPSALADVHHEFMNYILPFAVGNAHPGFM